MSGTLSQSNQAYLLLSKGCKLQWQCSVLYLAAYRHQSCCVFVSLSADFEFVVCCVSWYTGTRVVVCVFRFQLTVNVQFVVCHGIHAPKLLCVSLSSDSECVVCFVSLYTGTKVDVCFTFSWEWMCCLLCVMVYRHQSCVFTFSWQWKCSFLCVLVYRHQHCYVFHFQLRVKV